MGKVADERERQLTEEYRRHLARELQRVVDDQFEGHQTKAAKAMGISQPHLSNILSGQGRSFGITALVRIREFTGRSIDALLGLRPLPDQELLERLRMSVELEAARLDRARRDRQTIEASAAARALAARETATENEPPAAPKKRRGRPKKVSV